LTLVRCDPGVAADAAASSTGLVPVAERSELGAPRRSASGVASRKRASRPKLKPADALVRHTAMRNDLRAAIGLVTLLAAAGCAAPATTSNAGGEATPGAGSVVISQAGSAATPFATSGPTVVGDGYATPPVVCAQASATAVASAVRPYRVPPVPAAAVVAPTGPDSPAGTFLAGTSSAAPPLPGVDCSPATGAVASGFATAGSGSAAPGSPVAVPGPPVTTSPTPLPDAGPSTSTPPLPPPPTFPADHALTVADNGAVVSATVGQQVRLLLRADGVPGNWDVPKLQGAAVTMSAHSGGYPTTAPLRATLLAAAPGTATVTTATDLACFHTSPACLPPVLGWTVTVRVTT
jgi:hypothetical protein